MDLWHRDWQERQRYGPCPAGCSHAAAFACREHRPPYPWSAPDRSAARNLARQRSAEQLAPLLGLWYASRYAQTVGAELRHFASRLSTLETDFAHRGGRGLSSVTHVAAVRVTPDAAVAHRLDRALVAAGLGRASVDTLTGRVAVTMAGAPSPSESIGPDEAHGYASWVEAGGRGSYHDYERRVRSPPTPGGAVSPLPAFVATLRYRQEPP